MASPNKIWDDVLNLPGIRHARKLKKNINERAERAYGENHRARHQFQIFGVATGIGVGMATGAVFPGVIAYVAVKKGIPVIMDKIERWSRSKQVDNSVDEFIRKHPDMEPGMDPKIKRKQLMDLHKMLLERFPGRNGLHTFSQMLEYGNGGRFVGTMEDLTRSVEALKVHNWQEASSEVARDNKMRIEQRERDSIHDQMMERSEIYRNNVRAKEEKQMEEKIRRRMAEQAMQKKLESEGLDISDKRSGENIFSPNTNEKDFSYRVTDNLSKEKEPTLADKFNEMGKDIEDKFSMFPKKGKSSSTKFPEQTNDDLSHFR